VSSLVSRLNVYDICVRWSRKVFRTLNTRESLRNQLLSYYQKLPITSTQNRANFTTISAHLLSSLEPGEKSSRPWLSSPQAYEHLAELRPVTQQSFCCPVHGASCRRTLVSTIFVYVARWIRHTRHRRLATGLNGTHSPGPPSSGMKHNY
jgi:hypothetical protein